MHLLDANKFRDLTDAEIIALAETAVILVEDEHGRWSWMMRGPAWPRVFSQPAFSTKLGAADDAVCELVVETWPILNFEQETFTRSAEVIT